jgi:hypothetical protein
MYINMAKFLHPRDVGLILSYRCQAACAHCLYNCGPGWRDWMSLEDVRTALTHARSVWGQGFQVHLTGGEPFMNFPLLLSASRIAVELGIPVYVETNAAWCRDVARAEERFKQLRQAGMAAVLVSVSPFHQETIPLQRTLDGIAAARQAFGPSRVIVYQSDWLAEMARFGSDDPVLLQRYVDDYGMHQAGLRLWMGYGLISGGRAGYRLGSLVPKHPPQAYLGIDCRNELLFAQHSHLDLYGNFIPAFCGGISLGKWHALDRLVKTIREGKFTPLIKMLVEKGPFGLFQEAVESFGYSELSEGYAGKCHLCVDVRRHLVDQGAYAEHLLPVQFYEQDEWVR